MGQIDLLSCQVTFDEGRNNKHGDVVLVWRTDMTRDPEHTLTRLTVVAVVAVALLLIGSTPVGEAPGVTELTARANGCYTNIDLLNVQLELYNANTGGYPANLVILAADTGYFPDGVPVCPVTGNPYPATLVTNRVDASSHDPHP